MRAPYVLISDVDWCDRRYDLFTDHPKSASYVFDCPFCKKRHEFVVVERLND